MPRAAHFLTPLLRPAPDGLQLRTTRLSTPIATRVECAFDSRSRNRGLLGRHSFDAGSALVIAPSGAVHTFGMQFAIDLVYARRDGRVIKLRRSMPRNRVSAALGAFAVIELPGGTIDRTGLVVGDVLEIRPSDGAPGLQAWGTTEADPQG
jgi:uncharacterized membrane protein (UPF0127 family)